ncbi:rod shape-determining protein MreD [Thermoflexus hugenholtzii]|uniref:Rod shape-determining protein MreD n=1 Tax=Thermoflexus hugenholtzii JAD2 TaxID=877466 RepID=A0A212PYD5_9CHLR|nr:rod shape-determining protein MreD [Thermoflexus hugenholtzii]SNB52023.1 rod shape-determining protein MreD [Thermoflexus hugenholtzii JAD2]
MRNRIGWAAMVLGLAALLQATWIPLGIPEPGRPNLVFLVVATVAFLGSLEEGLAWAVGGGLWLDLFSGGPLGVSALALLAVVPLAHGLSRPVFRGRLVMPAAVAAGGTLLMEGVRGILLAVLQYPVDPGYALRQVIGPEILWNTLGMLALYPALRRLRPRPERPELGG